MWLLYCLYYSPQLHLQLGEGLQVQCTVAQSRKHPQGFHSLLHLAASSKYDNKQPFYFVLQAPSQNVGYLPTIYSEDVLHPYGVIFNFLSCRETWGVVTL